MFNNWRDELLQKAKETHRSLTGASNEELLAILLSRVESQVYRLAASSNDTHQLQKIFDTLESHVTRTRSSVNFTLNAHVPIHRIPNETLRMIFEWHVAMMESENSRRGSVFLCPNWYPLASVCKHWRQLALTSPELFTTVDCGWPPASLDLALQSCGSRVPLKLYIPPIPFTRTHPISNLGSGKTLSEPSMTLGKDLPTLLPFISRSAFLEITLQEMLVQCYPNGLSLSGPALRTLYLTFLKQEGSHDSDMSPLCRNRVKTALRFLFQEPPLQLASLHCTGLGIPADVIDYPGLTTITMGSNTLQRRDLQSSLQVLSRIPALTFLEFRAPFSDLNGAFASVPPAQASVALTHLQKLVFSDLLLKDAFRILDPLSLPCVTSISLGKMQIRESLQPLAPYQVPLPKIWHPDLQRLTGQGISLKLSWRTEGSSYFPRAILLESPQPNWSEGDPALLDASFTYIELPSTYVSQTHPLITFVESIYQLSFEGVQMLEIIPTTSSLSILPPGAPNQLFAIYSSLTILRLENLGWDNILECLSMAQPLLFPHLSVLSLRRCAGNGESLLQFLWSRMQMRRTIQTCDLRSSKIYPRGYDPAPLAQFVGQLRVIP